MLKYSQSRIWSRAAELKFKRSLWIWRREAVRNEDYNNAEALANYDFVHKKSRSC